MIEELKTNTDIDINKPYFWGLNPIFWSKPNVFIKDIYLLEHFKDENNIEGYYKFYGTQIEEVKILGVVIEKDVNSKIITYTVDDGTESIECIFFKKSAKESELNEKLKYQLFDTLSITGKINDFNNKRNLYINEIRKENDVNCEIFFWEEVIRQRKLIQKKCKLSETKKKEVIEFRKEKIINNKDEYYKEFSASLNSNKRIKLDNEKKEIELKLKIHDYIYQKKNSNFYFSDIKKVESLRKLAIEIVKQKDEESISKLFSRIIRQLVKEGTIYLCDEVKDIYEIVHYKYNVAPLIFLIIYQKYYNNYKNSFSYENIVDFLSKSSLKYATTDTINKSLNYLVNLNKIYKVVQNNTELYFLYPKYPK